MRTVRVFPGKRDLWPSVWQRNTVSSGSRGGPGWAQVWRTVTETYGKELIDNYEAILEANEERLGRARKQFKVEQDITETFDDVKGQETAVEKAGRVGGDMLAHSDAYRLAGRGFLLGALLVGPPGTGKTLWPGLWRGDGPACPGNGPGCARAARPLSPWQPRIFWPGLGTGADRVRDLFCRRRRRKPPRL